MDTADSIYGGAAQVGMPTATIAGPGTVAGTPAYAQPLTGMRGLHPSTSPTPWVIGMAIVLALLLHPKAGFNVGGKASLG